MAETWLNTTGLSGNAPLCNAAADCWAAKIHIREIEDLWA